TAPSKRLVRPHLMRPLLSGARGRGIVGGQGSPLNTLGSVRDRDVERLLGGVDGTSGHLGYSDGHFAFAGDVAGGYEACFQVRGADRHNASLSGLRDGHGFLVGGPSSDLAEVDGRLGENGSLGGFHEGVLLLFVRTSG